MHGQWQSRLTPVLKRRQIADAREGVWSQIRSKCQSVWTLVDRMKRRGGHESRLRLSPKTSRIYRAAPQLGAGRAEGTSGWPLVTRTAEPLPLANQNPDRATS